MKPLLVAVLVVAVVGTPAVADAASAREPDMVVFESGGLQPDTIEAVKAVADRLDASSSIVDAGTLRMLGVVRGDETVQGFDPGFGVPMSIMVLAPGEVAPLIDPTYRAALETPDSIVMSERSASLRGALVGDTVTLEGWNGDVVEVRISAVLPDAQLDWYEIVMSTDLGVRLGLDRPSRILLWNLPSNGLAELLLSAVDAKQSVRITPAGAQPDDTDFTLSTIEQKERFGEFSFRRTGRADFIQIDPEWVERNIVTVRFPETGTFRCHRAVVPYLRSAFAELRTLGLSDLIDFSDFQAAGGCYVPRLMRGGDKGFALSRHAWGTAIDINPSANPYGGETTLPEEFGAVFRRWGFAWGAGWTVPDSMHFEWKQIPPDPDRHDCAPIRISRVAEGVRIEHLLDANAC